MRNLHYSKQLKKARLKLARLLKNKATSDALVLLLRVAIAIAGPALLAECGHLPKNPIIDQAPDQSVDEVAQMSAHRDING